MAPGVAHEHAWRDAGYKRIAGIDEAGRGCWAGPVVAAAVVLPSRVYKQPELLAGVDDSKTLTVERRESLYETIVGCARGVGVGVIPATVIDVIGIVPATRCAMVVALFSLPVLADALLIDALSLKLSLPEEVLVKGDARCLSIAAASIVAKVTRDHLMVTADRAYPGYQFARHKGYGTRAHQQALHTLGPCGLHRFSFRPVAAIADCLV